MGRQLRIVILGLGLVCASQGWSGTTGNGSATQATTHYTYCFGGHPDIAYFSAVITSAPAADNHDLNGRFQTAYGNYLTHTLGVVNNGGQCFTSDAMVSAVNGKKQHEAELLWRKWTIVETKWAGVPATAP